MDLSTLTDADRWAKAAIESIKACGLTVDPRTFTIWYEYHRQQMPELNRMLDILLSNRQVVDEARVERIYERFFGEPPASEAIRSAADRMVETVGQVLEVLEGAGEAASRSGAAVRQASAAFAARETSIGDLVQSLLAEARVMAERSMRMEAELIRNAELMKSLQQTLDTVRKDAVTDALTGLANRRSFDEALQTMAGQAMNNGTALSLLLLDIDHFKRINDRWGHPVGDQVIQLVAATIRRQIRSCDFAARYGGEEFAVVLPATSLTDAASVGNKLREAFATHRVVVRDTKTPIGSVTISLGAAAYSAGESLAHWVQRADAALYAAKQGGRNRLVADPTPQPAGC